MSGGPTTATALELTRRAFASASGGDFEGLSEYLTPDSIFDASPWGLGTYTGPAAIRRFLEDWIGSFDEYEREAEEMIDLGHGIVFAAAVTRARPAGSRDRVWLRGASVFVWADGLLARVTNYRDVDEGRAAAERAAELPDVRRSSVRESEQTA
jgi:ketosteroid isomerase-like protein